MNVLSGFDVMRRTVVPLLAAAALSGCAGYLEEQRAARMMAEGDTQGALEAMEKLAASQPLTYRLPYVRAREAALAESLQKARRFARRQMTAPARDAYEAMLRLDPASDAALVGLAALAREEQEARDIVQARAAAASGDPATALRLTGEILAANPGHLEARALSQAILIERNRTLLAEPDLSESLRKPVTLELRDVPVPTVLEILSQTSGVNFVLDKDVKPDLRATIFARNTAVVDALDLVLRTSQLSRKVLDESTLLIYPDSEEKRRRYEDLVMRTFRLKSADPKKMQDMVRALIGPKSIHVDDRARTMIVRDNLHVIAAIERLVAAYDVADAEVVLEVEILEINSSTLLNAGLQYPDRLSASVFGAARAAGSLTVDELRRLGRDDFQLSLPDPLLVLNLKQTGSDAKTLANPRIRVTTGQKAKVLIGDKVPVITTTVNQTSSASTESVSYLDVGLKLEVAPEVHADGEVTMGVDLEVSNIVKEIRSTTGLLAYQIGTRNASTTLRLHDGETQVLAGLIKEEGNDNTAGIPGLGRVPGVGRLFSNTTETGGRSEIVLLITPRIVRGVAAMPAHVAEFPSGTLESASVRPLRLTAGAQYSGSGPGPMPAAPAGAGTGASTGASTGTGTSGTSDLPMVELRLPARVASGADFNVVVGFAPAYESIEFDLVTDRPGLELIGPVPGALLDTATVQVLQSGLTIHVKGGRRRAADASIVATLALKAAGIRGSPVSLVVQNVRVVGLDGVPIPAGIAPPAALAVAP